MNPRIRELAEQATGAEEYDGFRYFDKAKFAELIVRECAKVAWYHTPDTEELEYSHLIKDEILKHFGVED